MPWIEGVTHRKIPCALDHVSLGHISLNHAALGRVGHPATPYQNIKAYHQLQAPVRIGGVAHDARVTIREDNNGRLYYDLDNGEAPSVPRTVSPERDQTPTHSASTEPPHGTIDAQGDDINLTTNRTVT